ncbi:MAG TPA: hypothetical protein LFW11_00950 [Rickettsia endosymbiont of Proechinophthirus fluctus]|nr:hypothetical protein [Rickettsia endosymbiont of Proechinophthirus fluctus]HJD53953.1 hypothetical protein [Rickettsia endosymbiont of Proechinophthirus fluctus]
MVKTIINLVDPKFKETIYDPFLVLVGS